MFLQKRQCSCSVCSPQLLICRFLSPDLIKYLSSHTHHHHHHHLNVSARRQDQSGSNCNAKLNCNFQHFWKWFDCTEDLAAPLTLVTRPQWYSTGVWSPHLAEMLNTLNFNLLQVNCQMTWYQAFSVYHLQMSHLLITDFCCITWPRPITATQM